MPNSKIIVIAGPTASGKSSLALNLAKQTSGVVINADSMQVYKDIPILAAAPSKEDLRIVPHKLYGIYEACVRGNVADWLNLAQKEIASARAHNKTPVIVGGTGLYLEALIKGLSPIPETPAEIREQTADILAKGGLAALYDIIAENDPETAARLKPGDTTRLTRAVEIFLHTKKPLSYWYALPPLSSFTQSEFITVYIKPQKEELASRSSKRFDDMLAAGAIDEVRRLLALNLPDSLPAMRALGVQELKAFLNGLMSLNEASDLAKLHTRQYAKRQMTWFNNRYDAAFTLQSCWEENKNFVDDIKKAL